MTASDYIEIQQLLARYPYALDTGQRKGQMWVDLFTTDGTFDKSQGPEALLKIAWQHRPGQGPSYDSQLPAERRHHADARGSDRARCSPTSSTSARAGQTEHDPQRRHYQDAYVRTADGWRIKNRTVYAKKSGADAGTGSGRR